jgi:hypothetical protein
MQQSVSAYSQSVTGNQKQQFNAKDGNNIDLADLVKAV